MTPVGSLHGTVVAITGGARGIGRATADAFVDEGASVAVGDLHATARLPSGRTRIDIPLDVRDSGSFTGFLDAVEERLGPLDVLVNNAGVMLLSPFAAEDVARSQLMIDVNLGGVLLGTRLALERMLPRGRGHIVNVASSVGEVALPGAATYSATKHAVLGLSDSVRQELRGTGVDISCVLPGLVNTELGSGVPQPSIGTVQPQVVAAAIVRAIEHPRFKVFVPKSVGLATRLLSMVPLGCRDWLTRTLHADAAFLEHDPSARAAYERRYVNQDEELQHAD